MALILTKPMGLVRTDALDEHLAHLLQSHYPAAAEGLRRRAWRYNTAVQQMCIRDRPVLQPDTLSGFAPPSPVPTRYAPSPKSVSYTHLDVYKRQV